MLTDFLQAQAALYASGAMTAEEREPFELVLEVHDELRGCVRGMAEVVAAIVLSTRAPIRAPTGELKARISTTISARLRNSTVDGMVRSGPDGRVEWINPSFSTMCGYTIDELRGKKLGPILQGEKTDRMAAARMQSAVHAYRPCRETILNYHKNGTPYLVDVAITPIFDDAGQPLWLIARERELPHGAAA